MGRAHPRWGLYDIGDLTGRIALVTGANSGIGAEAALELAARGAHVVLGCRDPIRARRSADRIDLHAPGASVDLVTIDLASQESVHRAAAEIIGRYDRLDLLVNNAGVMAVPFEVTEDGFEIHMGTNHLGPFTLTALLADLLATTMGSRVVALSSNAHRLARLDTSSAQALQHLPGGHNPWQLYANSKLADLLFAFELDRRLRQAGLACLSVAAHPGYTHTALMANGPATGRSGLRRRLTTLPTLVAQPVNVGSLPLLYAATAPGLTGGEYVGPAGLGGWRGPPVLVGSSRRARHPQLASDLWRLSEELTGMSFTFAPAAPAGGPGTGTVGNMAEPLASDRAGFSQEVSR